MPVYENGELVLYGFVGDDYWNEGFTARDVLAALAEHGTENDLSVRLNSGGGYVDAGRSIYNALKLHQGNVTINIDAVAASSASLIAMAGDRIVMRSGAVMMIHDPATVTVGTADDHEVSKQALERMAQSFAETYAARTGQNLDDVRAAMKATTWMTADEAVAAGYADEADQATAKMAAAFDYRAYAQAPEELTEISAKKGWSFQTAKSAASAAITSQKEIEMADTQTADAQAAAIAQAKEQGGSDAKERIKAITGLAEAEGRADLADHIAFDTDMSVDAAKAMLAKAPKIAAADASDDLPNRQEYDASRSLASGQAQQQPGKQSPKAEINPTAIYKARQAALKGA